MANYAMKVAVSDIEFSRSGGELSAKATVTLTNDSANPVKTNRAACEAFLSLNGEHVGTGGGTIRAPEMASGESVEVPAGLSVGATILSGDAAVTAQALVGVKIETETAGGSISQQEVWFEATASVARDGATSRPALSTSSPDGAVYMLDFLDERAES